MNNSKGRIVSRVGDLERFYAGDEFHIMEVSRRACFITVKCYHDWSRGNLIVCMKDLANRIVNDVLGGMGEMMYYATEGTVEGSDAEFGRLEVMMIAA